MASSLIDTEPPRTQKAPHLRSLCWLSEAHGSGLGSPKAVAAKLRSSNMEHTGPLPPPCGSLGTGLHHCTHYLGEYGYPKKCYSLISWEAQPSKGKQRSASEPQGLSTSYSQSSAWPHLHGASHDSPAHPVTPLLWLTSLGLAGPACWPILSRPWELSRCWGRFLCFQTSGLAGLQAVAYAGLWQLSRDSASHV